MSAELRLQNLNDSTTYPLGLNPSLVKLLMFIEDRPRTKAELLRKGFSGEQVSGCWKDTVPDWIGAAGFK